MHICLSDDSVAFDGRHPLRRPLGGAQRAVAALAEALARRGHRVTVQNRCPEDIVVNGVHWLPVTAPPVADADVLIACRRPSLLHSLPSVPRRLLWLFGPPEPLAEAGNAAALASLQAAIVFMHSAQALRYTGEAPGCVIAPGVSPSFHPAAALMPETARDDEDGDGSPPIPPPLAITTTHPAYGLDHLLDLWVNEIWPHVPGGRLLVCSSLLSRPLTSGDPVPPVYAGLADKIREASACGVALQPPAGEEGMGELFRSARLHLYSGHPSDLACWTLADSQACALPAVARMESGPDARVINGETGWLVPDDAALANVAVQVLTSDALYHTLARAGAAASRRRSWDQVALEFESLWAPHSL